MEVLKPIYVAPNMTALTKMTKRKKKKWIFILYYLMKREGLDRMLAFAKQVIGEWGSRHEPKK